MTEIVKKETSGSRSILSFILRSGEWRKLMDVPHYKVLIAEALNDTVCQAEFRSAVIGYQIREELTVLVLRIEHRKIKKFFHYFFDQVRNGIRSYIELKKRRELKDLLSEERLARHDLFEKLFEEFQLHDDDMVRLLTGRPVVSSYYDPNLERMKESVRNDPFCSTLDYEGGRSAVLVRVMSRNDWKREEEK